MEGCMKITEAAERWGLSSRRIRVLCSDGRIPGVIRKGNLYYIPANATQPVDARSYSKRADKKVYTPLLMEVDALQKKLADMRPLSPAEVEALKEVFVVEHTYNSNAIEGNTLTLQETAMVLQGMTIDRKPLKDHLEAVGYKEAFEAMEELAKQKHPLSEYDIQCIHSLVLAHRHEDAGRYRRVPVRIAGALTEPVQPYLIQPKMEELITDMEEKYGKLHIAEQVSIFHLRFESIHPFIDGNGRTGRLLMNLQLIRAGYPPVNIKFADRRRYYEAFDSFARSGSPDDMITLVAEYLRERLNAVLEIQNSI